MCAGSLADRFGGDRPGGVAPDGAPLDSRTEASANEALDAVEDLQHPAHVRDGDVGVGELLGERLGERAKRGDGFRTS